ncbi:MAG: hypothetical protein K6G92_08585 [Bacteroidaceae bacterium]|nr:hypothetical protein [Bacteroidaceae bacterium]
MKGDPLVEKVYFWIAHRIAPNNYFLFRIIVWGTAQFLLWDTFKRISVGSHLALAIFVSIWMIWFSYGRVSLAMALAFWGLTIYYKSHRIPLLPKIIGICAIAASFYFHKSAIFLIIVSLLAIMTSKVNKTTFIICLIVFPILAQMLNDGFIDTIMLTMTNRAEDLNSYLEKAQYYMESDERGYGFGPLIGLFLEKLPYYLITVLGLIAVFRDSSNADFNEETENPELAEYDEEQAPFIPEDIKAYIRVLFFIILFSSLFLFSNSINTQVIYDRFIKFSFIPTTIVLAYLFEKPHYVNYAWWTYCIALFGTCYQMTYMLYCSITNYK